MDAYIGLGSNLGDRLATLRRAVTLLGEVGTVRRVSAVYETAPVGPPQPDYLNAALLLETALPPLPLLGRLLSIEAALGRVRGPGGTGERFGPRTLDLDLLLLGEGGQLPVSAPALTVPHPRLHERAFALRPLLDLDEGLRHPLLGVPLLHLYEACLVRDPDGPPRPLTSTLVPA